MLTIRIRFYLHKKRGMSMNTKGKKENKKKIIGTEDIKLILERYHIGKKPLAKLLGWGETTIIRYIEGDVPSREYSSKLQMLLEEPVYYYDLLMKRKDNLTGVAFRKSKKAVLSRIMSSKIYAVAYYYVNKSDAEISADYIQYLLFYVQAFSLAMRDKEIFQEELIVDGSKKLYIDVYKSLKCNGMMKLEVEDYNLSDEELEIIKSVIEARWYGPSVKGISRLRKPFLRVSSDDDDNRIISKDTMKSYFRDVLYQYNIHNAREISKYPDKRLRNIKNKDFL